MFPNIFILMHLNFFRYFQNFFFFFFFFFLFNFIFIFIFFFIIHFFFFFFFFIIIIITEISVHIPNIIHSFIIIVFILFVKSIRMHSIIYIFYIFYKLLSFFRTLQINWFKSISANLKCHFKTYFKIQSQLSIFFFKKNKIFINIKHL